MKKDIIVILGVAIASASLIGTLSLIQNIAFAVGLGAIAGVVLAVLKKTNK